MDNKIQSFCYKNDTSFNKYKLLLIFSAIISFVIFNNIKPLEIDEEIYNKQFSEEIQNTFIKNNKVNINQIEQQITKRKSVFNKGIKSIINIGFTLDPKYILQTMLTASSIMATQHDSTKIRFHFGVTKNFDSRKMIKLYSLKNKINNLTEFNFYYLKGATEKMKYFHPKGEACPGKFELPQLLPDDVAKLIIFDAGDVLVLRDLTEFYNYDMKENWVLGPPEPRCIIFVEKYNISKYINIGSILLDVNELKKNNFWDLYTKNRHLKIKGQPDQTLFNILVPDNKKNYFPFRLGSYTILCDDKASDTLKYEKLDFKEWLNSNLSNNFPEKPSDELGILAQTYNPLFIHQFCCKWAAGSGLSLYRILAKYFIQLADIKKELCRIHKGYCI